jgi:hypothetical protein
MEWELDWDVGIRQIHESYVHLPAWRDRYWHARDRSCGHGYPRQAARIAAFGTPQLLPKSSGEKVLLTIDP